MQHKTRPEYPHDSFRFRLTNRIIVALNRFNFSTGHIDVLSVVGRKSGKLYSTPVSVVKIHGKRYVMAVDEVSWVLNARAAGWAFLSHGRRKERMQVVEPELEERRVALREYTRQVPYGAEQFKRARGIAVDPESFAQAAEYLPVFRLDPTAALSTPFK